MPAPGEESEANKVTIQEALRRVVPRQPVDWFGFYSVENGSPDPLRCCRILDISPFGAGLELFAVSPEDPLEGLITVSFELRGRPTNVVWSEDQKSARVGVQFPEPSDAAKDYLRRMSGSRSRW